MRKFIHQLAQHIVEEKLPLEHLTIIFPSQRAKKYLHRDLYQLYDKPFFSPKITTMHQWISSLSPQPIIEKTRALFKLYDTHLAIDKEEPQSLDEFMKWGNILLSDFDEIDRYLIDANDLFRNLVNIKEIENWSFNADELTDGQKKFMRFWDLLSDYYSHFNKRLGKDGECYMGTAYKYVANHIDVLFDEDKNAHFIFAGFNALSPAETSIMKQLHQMGRATIFMDVDSYYMNDKNHEAGIFHREFMKKTGIKTLPFVADTLESDKKDIHIIDCSQPTGQAKVSATILSKDIPFDELSETLLLLADESLVVPVIKNIPAIIDGKKNKNVNITLGLPLKNTALKSWVNLFFSVQEHFAYFKTKKAYHKDFIQFIKHPFIIGMSSNDELKKMASIEQGIVNNNTPFLNLDILPENSKINCLIELFFKPWNLNSNEYPIASIRKINEEVFKGLKDTNTIEKSIIYHFDQSLIQLENVLNEFKPSLSLGTFKILFNHHWSNESIAYYGNPLDGLQVMGLLETRMIDFKNMIVVGLNDGKMPPTNPIRSMIMMDLRKYHGLPSPKEKQGLFAHHFYRLLHTVKKCWITYSSASLTNGMDEPSRFIHQLELELARRNKNITLKKYTYTIDNKKQQAEIISIKKTPSVLKRLDEYFNAKTSVSALKTFLRCPLDFYYKYLIGLRDEDKIEEDVEASTLGSFIHKTLEIMYNDYVVDSSLPSRKTLTVKAIDGMIAQQKSIMRKQFEHFFNTSSHFNFEGKNYLSLEVAQHLTENFLKKEREFIQEEKNEIKIIGLEVNLSKRIEVSIFNEKKTITFKGVIDRIDSIGEEVRIMDYKSGSCKKEDVKIPAVSKKLEDDDGEKIKKLVATIKKSKYVFQLLVYAMLYKEKYSKYPDKTGIISLANSKEGPFYLENKLTATMEELMQLFDKALEQIIESIYDEDAPFEHIEQYQFNYCNYCN